MCGFCPLPAPARARCDLCLSSCCQPRHMRKRQLWGQVPPPLPSSIVRGSEVSVLRFAVPLNTLAAPRAAPFRVFERRFLLWLCRWIVLRSERRAEAGRGSLAVDWRPECSFWRYRVRGEGRKSAGGGRPRVREGPREGLEVLGTWLDGGGKDCRVSGPRRPKDDEGWVPRRSNLR
jgi:hypothetical protein